MPMALSSAAGKQAILAEKDYEECETGSHDDSCAAAHWLADYPCLGTLPAFAGISCGADKICIVITSEIMQPFLIMIL
jgi:hypothetical protein